MKKVILIAVAAIAISLVADQSSATAQTGRRAQQSRAGLGRLAFPYPNQMFYAGNGFGGRNFGSGFESPPYFAMYPPVHYSGVVSRPYGVSPYAAPPGVMPIEMLVPVKPLRVKNPFFDEEVKGENSDDQPAEKKASHVSKNKVTRIINPYFGQVTRR